MNKYEALGIIKIIIESISQNKKTDWSNNLPKCIKIYKILKEFNINKEDLRKEFLPITLLNLLKGKRPSNVDWPELKFRLEKENSTLTFDKSKVTKYEVIHIDYCIKCKNKIIKNTKCSNCEPDIPISASTQSKSLNQTIIYDNIANILTRISRTKSGRFRWHCHINECKNISIELSNVKDLHQCCSYLTINKKLRIGVSTLNQLKYYNNNDTFENLNNQIQQPVQRSLKQSVNQQSVNQQSQIQRQQLIVKFDKSTNRILFEKIKKQIEKLYDR